MPEVRPVSDNSERMWHDEVLDIEHELDIKYPSTANGAYIGADTSAVSPPSPPSFPTVAIGAVPDDGPVKWLVEHLWLDQAVGIIGGEPKSYKSFAAAQIATCIAAGKSMLGEYETRQGRVLMFNAEDRPAMTRGRIAKMCRALDVDIASLDLYLIDVPALRLDDPEQVAMLSRTVAALKPSLLILDPLRDLHGLDENDAQLASALLAPLRIIQREHHCSVMLVHHMAKMTETNRRAGQRLRGSSVLHGWIDSALYLTHKDGAIRVEAEHRDAPAPEPLLVKLETAMTTSGDALWLQAQDSEETKEKKHQRQDMIENSVIAAVAAAKEPLTGRDLRGICKARSEAIVEAIRRLVSTGVLAEETIFRGGQACPGYRIDKERQNGF